MLFSSNDEYDQVFGVHESTVQSPTTFLARSNILSPGPGVYPLFVAYSRKDSSSPWVQADTSYSGSTLDYTVTVYYDIETGEYKRDNTTGSSIGVQVKIIELTSDASNVDLLVDDPQTKNILFDSGARYDKISKQGSFPIASSGSGVITEYIPESSSGKTAMFWFVSGGRVMSSAIAAERVGYSSSGFYVSYRPIPEGGVIVWRLYSE